MQAGREVKSVDSRRGRRPEAETLGHLVCNGGPGAGLTGGHLEIDGLWKQIYREPAGSLPWILSWIEGGSSGEASFGAGLDSCWAEAVLGDGRLRHHYSVTPRRAVGIALGQELTSSLV